MSDSDERLPTLPLDRQKALEVLLLGGTIADAARAAGKAERTVRYWMRTVEFDAVFRDTQRAALTRCRLRLAVMAEKALDVIDECMDPFEKEVNNKQAKAKRRRIPMALRRAAARDTLELLGLTDRKAVQEDPLNEAELEAALRARGWVKREEVKH